MILYKLVSLSDYVRVGAVCKPWYFVAMEKKVEFFENKCCKQVPFLMVPTEDNSEERRSLYSITHNKLYDLQLQLPYKKRLSGSSHGWVFTVKESFNLILINPFSGATIELPPIMDRSKYKTHKPPEVEFEIMKATLSADPVSSPNDCIISAIYGGNKRLAFIQPGDKAWTYIDKERYTLIFDVIYYKGQIFAVDYFNGIIKVDLNTRVGESMAPQVKEIAPRISQDDVFDRAYLVESSSGDLLLVQRFVDYEDDDFQHTTDDFLVFKVLLQEINEKGWPEQVEVKSLGGDTLFLGDNHSICVLASKWPGCQPNSIYYTDDFIDVTYHLPQGRRDIGIFNVENESFGTHYILDPSHKHMPPSIWIVPTINGN